MAPEKIELTAATLADQPQILQEAFEQMVGPYKNLGMAGVRVDTEKLLVWEKKCHEAFSKMSLSQIKHVLMHYEGELRELNKEQTRTTEIKRQNILVMRRVIENFLCDSDIVKKHIKYYNIRSETRCNSRIAHLVGGSGREPQNALEALESALQEESAAQIKKQPPKPGR